MKLMKWNWTFKHVKNNGIVFKHFEQVQLNIWSFTLKFVLWVKAYLSKIEAEIVRMEKTRSLQKGKTHLLYHAKNYYSRDDYDR